MAQGEGPARQAEAIMAAAQAALRAKRAQHEGHFMADGGQRVFHWRMGGRRRGRAGRGMGLIMLLLLLALLGPLLLMVGLLLGAVALAAGVAALVFVLRRIMTGKGPIIRATIKRAEDLNTAGDTKPSATQALPELAGHTALWLARQQALPAPAADLARHISQQLANLAPQLAALETAKAPAPAQHLRQMLSEHLPELLDAYGAVPPALRAESHAGTSPDAQLTEGLQRIDSELGELSRGIAGGALDRLAVHARYLDYRYTSGAGLDQP
jgi:hypothetical protein